MKSNLTLNRTHSELFWDGLRPYFRRNNQLPWWQVCEIVGNSTDYGWLGRAENLQTALTNRPKTVMELSFILFEYLATENRIDEAMLLPKTNSGKSFHLKSFVDPARRSLIESGSFEELYPLFLSVAMRVNFVKSGLIPSQWTPEGPLEASCRKLWELLGKEGPLVLFGRFGTPVCDAETSPSKELFFDREVYDWKPISPCTPKTEVRTVVVVGLSAFENITEVLFRAPPEGSVKDLRIFVMTYKRFVGHLTTDRGTSNNEGCKNIPGIYGYRVKSEREEFSSSIQEPLLIISPEEMEYVQRLLELSLDLILTNDEYEVACRQLGLEIFAAAKEANNGQSTFGVESLNRIFQALAFHGNAGKRCRQMIEHVWAEVTDHNKHPI